MTHGIDLRTENRVLKGLYAQSEADRRYLTKLIGYAFAKLNHDRYFREMAENPQRDPAPIIDEVENSLRYMLPLIEPPKEVNGPLKLLASFRVSVEIVGDDVDACYDIIERFEHSKIIEDQSINRVRLLDVITLENLQNLASPPKSVVDSEKGQSKRWNQLRAETIARDGGKCVICDLSQWEKLAVHHILPRRCDGKDELPNLMTVCHSCHMRIHGVMRVRENATESS